MIENRRRLPSLNALRVFEVAARHLNFRSAAEELGVTQGAVAQQVRGLESELDLKLFDRLPRVLRLTDEGRAYIVHIRHAFEIITEATETLCPLPRHLTISVTPSFASKWLIPRLPLFTSQHPDIDLRILATAHISDFLTDAVDIALRYGQPPFGNNVNFELLFDQMIIAVGNPALIATLGQPQHKNDLCHYTLLHDAHNHWPEFIEQVFPGSGEKIPKNIRFNQTSLAIEAAIAGQGLALANPHFVADDIEAGRLVQLSGHNFVTDAGFYIVTPRKVRHPLPVAEVKNWLLKMCQD